MLVDAEFLFFPLTLGCTPTCAGLLKQMFTPNVQRAYNENGENTFTGDFRIPGWPPFIQ